MKTIDTPADKCSSCGYRFNATTDLTGDAVPRPGDYSICIKCGHLMVFNDDLRLREPTDAEIVEVAGDPQMLDMQKAIALHNKLFPRGS
jgi:hypothetical protein